MILGWWSPSPQSSYSQYIFFLLAPSYSSWGRVGPLGAVPTCRGISLEVAVPCWACPQPCQCCVGEACPFLWWVPLHRQH